MHLECVGFADAQRLATGLLIGSKGTSKSTARARDLGLLGYLECVGLPEHS